MSIYSWSNHSISSPTQTTQKYNIKCNTNNNTSEISYSKISKGFICKKCAEKYYSQYFLIPFEFLDSTCTNHGLNNPNKDKDKLNNSSFNYSQFLYLLWQDILPFLQPLIFFLKKV